MLVGDGDALQAVDLLDLVDQVHLQRALAEDIEDVVRVARAVDERVAGAQAFSLLHVDVDAAGNGVLLFLSVVGGDVDLALALGDLAEAHHAVDLADDGGVVRLARLEELDHARQASGDVLGARGFARDLGQDVSGEELVAVGHHQVGARWHQVALAAADALDQDGGLALLVGGVGHHQAAEPGHLVHLVVQRDSLLQVAEVDGAGDLRQQREGVGVPSPRMSPCVTLTPSSTLSLAP